MPLAFSRLATRSGLTEGSRKSLGRFPPARARWSSSPGTTTPPMSIDSSVGINSLRGMGRVPPAAWPSASASTTSSPRFRRRLPLRMALMVPIDQGKPMRRTSVASFSKPTPSRIMARLSAAPMAASIDWGPFRGCRRDPLDSFSSVM